MILTCHEPYIVTLDAQTNNRVLHIQRDYLCVTANQAVSAGFTYPCFEIEQASLRYGGQRVSVWYSPALLERFGARWEAAKEAKP